MAVDPPPLPLIFGTSYWRFCNIIFLTLLGPAFFGSLKPRGWGQICPHPQNGCNGWEVPKMGWNLISYQDWCQTRGFTTFGYLEPPQLMVWKSDFFRGSMRFVRVPPYESWPNWTTFCNCRENGAFFGVKSVAPSSTLKMRKSKENSTCLRIHTRKYVMVSKRVKLKCFKKF